MSSSHSQATRRAFTLVELLVVIAIIGILVGMVLPAVQQVREAARRTACLNNMRQVLVACHNYNSSNEKFPSAVHFATTGSRSWMVGLLPYLDQQNLADEVKNGTGAQDLSRQNKIPLLLCPSAIQDDEFATDDDSASTNHYLACMGAIGSNSDGSFIHGKYTVTTGTSGSAGTNGLFSPQSDDPTIAPTNNSWREKYGKSTDDCRDGSSNTLALMEFSRAPTENWAPLRKGWAFGILNGPGGTNEIYSANAIVGFPVPWLSAAERPTPINANLTAPLWNQVPASSNHPGGCMVGMMDGATKFVNENIELDAYMAAANMSDGEKDALE